MFGRHLAAHVARHREAHVGQHHLSRVRMAQLQQNTRDISSELATVLVMHDHDVSAWEVGNLNSMRCLHTAGRYLEL